jgi:hypothetical protein
MPEVIKWMDIAGKKLLFINFRGLKGDDLIVAAASTEKFFLETPPDKNEFLHVLVDITGAIVDTKVMDKFKAMTKNIKGYKHKTAILGMTPAKRVLLNAINFLMGQESKTFEDENSAVDWLFKS